MEEVDTTPLVEYFSEFFTTTYKQKVDELSLKYPSVKSLEVDYSILEMDNPDLADRLMKQPELVIKSAEEAIKLLNITLPGGIGAFTPHIRFFNFKRDPKDELMVEHIGSRSLNELIVFKGVITRRAEVMHKVKVAVFECGACGNIFRFHVTRDFAPPKKCEGCKRLTLRQMDDESEFTDIQRCEVQELLEKVTGGSPAARIELMLEDDMVNSIAPGENIEVVGTLRLKPPLKTKNKQELIYGRYVEVNHLTSLKRDFEEIDISKEDEKRILELARMPNIEDLIVQSIAPSIYGHTEVKKALALQLFGGTRGKTMEGGAPIRDDIHILLIGDPGSAKTRFLQEVTTIAPKSIFVSGKTVSGVGLTVAAEKDELGDGGWTLKAGALILASGGSAAIDEFDKIGDEDRAALHEVMESQTVSIAKAGMVAKFRAKTAIVSAANPKYGRFDQNRNLAEQFNIPPTLLSRFDLIFPIVDVLDRSRDEELADHILKTHLQQEKKAKKRNEVIEREILRKYIAYSRRMVFPKLTNEAIAKIKNFYVEMRSMGKDQGAVTITPRYLEGLVRLAEANAKLRLNPLVEARDADAAVSLMEYVMKKVMVDRETGRFDVDIVATGRSKTQTERIQKYDTIVNIIRELVRKYDSAELEKVVSQAEGYGLQPDEAERIIEELKRQGRIYEKSTGFVKLVEDDRKRKGDEY
ncbi:MAG: minichromosome maintenance protein MCM [Candidatus Bilamarchaeaceae archaeon]